MDRLESMMATFMSTMQKNAEPARPSTARLNIAEQMRAEEELEKKATKKSPPASNPRGKRRSPVPTQGEERKKRGAKKTKPEASQSVKRSKGVEHKTLTCQREGPRTLRKTCRTHKTHTRQSTSGGTAMTGSSFSFDGMVQCILRYINQSNLRWLCVVIITIFNNHIIGERVCMQVSGLHHLV